MKNIILTRLDRRHSGYGKFNYFASIPFLHSPLLADRDEIFCNWRIWCWDTWGPSCELECYNIVKNYSNKHWCWEQWEKRGMRIYLADEQDASAFTLRWL